MGNVYSLDAERNLILYRAGTNLYIRSTSGENLTRPVTLCTDYRDSLSDATYNGTVYYAYRSTALDIVVRSITDLQNIYKISNQEIPDCRDPRLIAFRDDLILFYSTKSPLNGAYYLKAVFPLKPGKRISLPETAYAESLVYGILVMTDRIILCAISPKKQMLFSLNTAYEPAIYPPDSPRLEAQLCDAQQKLDSTSAKLNDAQQKLDNATDKLTDTQQKLDTSSAKLNDAQQQLNTTAAKLDDTTAKLRDTQQKLDTSSAQLRHANQKLDTTTAKLNDTQQQLDNITAKLHDTQQRFDDTTNELVRTKSSLSDAQHVAEKLQTQNARLEAALQSQEQTHNATIESVRAQYSELMNTATRYREEAARWHGIAHRRDAKPIPGESLITDSW